MSAPLHMESPGGADNGDVLASIRRLISSGDAAVPPLAPQGAALGNPSPNIPFRLRPDALVATSDMGEPSEPLDDPAPPRGLAEPALLPTSRADSAPLSRPLAEDAQTPHISPPPADPAAATTTPAARPEPQSYDEGTDMHALHPATAPHLHLDATAEPAAAEATPQLHIPAPASTTPDTAPADNPLRALLRGAVRDELEREMRHRLETDLRQLIRAELSAALTEALTRPAAA